MSKLIAFASNEKKTNQKDVSEHVKRILELARVTPESEPSLKRLANRLSKIK